MFKKVSIITIAATAISACLPQTQLPTWYIDSDGDGWGSSAISQQSETAISGYVQNSNDCDDSNASIGPHVTEVADSIDNNCDGLVDEGFNYVFVTSTSYDGEMGGPGGADDLCQQAANAGSVISGTYKAWLAGTSSNEEIADRIHPSINAYVLPSGVVIADDFDDLVDGTLANAIDENENGGDASGFTPWTNTNADGTSASTQFDTTCVNFDHNLPGPSQNAVVGNTSVTDGTWTNNTTQECDNTNPLICIQQKEDYVVNGAEEPEPDPDPTPLEKIVFVTSKTYSGDLGGLAGADGLCQATADSVPLDGTFKAILSNGTTAAKDRLTNHASNVAIKDVAGTTIAMGMDDMWDGNGLTNGIDLDNTGASVSFASVWSGTTTTGLSDANHCNNWSGTGNGVIGVATTNSEFWINDGVTFGCSSSLRFYCIEQ